MKLSSFSRASLAVLFTLPLAGAATAARAADAAAGAPPAPTDKTYSSINGQLVPVGEHNLYTYEFPRWNLSLNPVGWVLGSFGASVSYGFHDNVAARLDVNYFNQVDGNEKGIELGAGLPIYFRRTYQGVFLEPGVIYRRGTDAEMPGAAPVTTMGPQVLLGWHWMWDSGLNVAAAIGLGRNFSATSSTEAKVFGNAYLRFGYAF
jgi:hypothetical protein